jgi:hypothetical protein
MARRAARTAPWLVAVALVLIAGGLFALTSGKEAPGRWVAVYRLSSSGRTLVARYPLGAATIGRRVPVKGPLGLTQIEVRGGRARVVASPCPDQLCVNFGWRSREGQFAACLPNRVLLVVEERR